MLSPVELPTWLPDHILQAMVIKYKGFLQREIQGIVPPTPQLSAVTHKSDRWQVWVEATLTINQTNQSKEKWLGIWNKLKVF